jgi:hypothetical protein
MIEQLSATIAPGDGAIQCIENTGTNSNAQMSSNQNLLRRIRNARRRNVAMMAMANRVVVTTRIVVLDG